ncbi:MAG: energy transducer TonB [Acidobacteria bacterium]|nr:energy transducer TonB [Acidobacteriota bacterium]
MPTEYLKRVLPFALTFIVGAGLGGFAGLFKSRTVEVESLNRHVTSDPGRRACASRRGASKLDWSAGQHSREDLALSGDTHSRVNIIATESFPADTTMYERRSGWQPVSILWKPDLPYTRRARHNERQGVVRLSVVFGADGKTKLEEVVSTLPDGLTEEAAAAVRAIEFSPATLDGVPVSTHGIVDCIFELVAKKRP